MINHQIIPSKADSRITLNTTLLAISIGVFFLMINMNSNFLSQKILTTQLILSIPLLFISNLAYSKIGYRKQVKKWNIFGWITFIIGFGFILNVIGIISKEIIGITISIMFFVICWVLIFIYSFIDISYDKFRLKERLIKDGFFIFIQTSLGLIVVLGII